MSVVKVTLIPLQAEMLLRAAHGEVFSMCKFGEQRAWKSAREALREAINAEQHLPAPEGRHGPNWAGAPSELPE